MAKPLISIRDLKVHFKRRRSIWCRPSTASAWIFSRERPWGWWANPVAAKTTLGRAILRLTEITSGSVFFAVRISRTCRIRKCGSSAVIFR